MSESSNTPSSVVATPDPSSPYAGVVNGDGSFKENWADSLPEDLKPYAGSVATYKDLPALIKGHAETKKYVSGLGTMVKVPGEKATDEDIAKFRQGLGIPDKPEGYGLDKAPEGHKGEYDVDTAKGLAALLHKHHASPALAKELVALDLSRQKGWDEAMTASEAEFQAGERAKLEQEWGVMDVDKRMGEAIKAAAQFGVPDIDKATPAEMKIVFARMWSILSEDGTARKALGISAESLAVVGDNPMTRAEDIMNNPNNPLYPAYHSLPGHEANHQAVRDQVHRLLQGQG